MDTLELQVGGMSCTRCEERLGKALRRLDGVREVRADHTTGRVEVRLGTGAADRAVVVERIENAGYEVAGGAGP
ncbi:hypothetical protein BH20ACT6_BH20ACT6_18290 [soil metagenome]